MAASSKCGPAEFFHEGSASCRPCAAICDPAKPYQHEPALCRSQCPIYSVVEQLKQQGKELDAARALGGTALVLSAVVLVAVLALVGVLLFFVYRRPRKLIDVLQSRISRVDVETPEMKVKMSNNNHRAVDISRDSVCTVSASVSEAEMRVSHAAPQQPPPPPPSTALTLPLSPVSLPAAPPPVPARHPSEDSTLDYAAYDNPALSPSSSPLPPGSGTTSNGKALDAVLEAALDPGSLPGSVPRGLHHGHHNHLNLNGNLANGSVARMESSF